MINPYIKKSSAEFKYADRFQSNDLDKTTIYSADMVEMVELTFFESCLFVAHYNLTESAKVYTRKLLGFTSAVDCVDNAFHLGVQYYSQLISGRYNSRLITGQISYAAS